MAVHVIDTIKPKNNLDFPVVEAEDVKVSDTLRLDEALENNADDLAALAATISDKADAADLTALEAEVDAKADSSDLTTAAANLQGQIDNLITPVTQDAEVQNARVGADSTSYQTLKARLDAEYTALEAENTALKDDLGTFNFFDGMQLGFIPTSGTTYPIINSSYPNATYVIVNLPAGQKIVISGFTAQNTSGRARCIVNGEIVSSVSGNTENYTTTVNLSNSINNGTITALKDIQIALVLLDGITISGTKATIGGYASVSEMLFETYNSTFTLKDASDKLADEVDEVVEDLGGLTEKVFDIRDVQYLIPDIPKINYAQGYSVSAGATSVEIDVNSNYDSYWYITDKPITLYAVPTSGQYYAIGVLTDASGSWEEHDNYNIMRGASGARYRLSDNNLPTKSTPLTVPAGSMIVFTFPASKYYSVVYEDQVSSFLSDTVRLNDAQIAQIPGQKKVYFKYSATSGGDSSNEHIDVYVPYKSGFIHYLIVHTESQSINADVWRISLAYITDDAFNNVTQITTSGEWECAIHLPDRSDFSGGYAHGDEVLINDPTFFKDGIPVDITEFTDYTSCNEFSFVERTTMYDPNTTTRGIAEHGSSHIFSVDDLKIQQSVLWLVDTSLTNTYLAMLPIAKAVSHSFYTNARHIITNIGSTSHTESKATEAVVYGDDLSCKFSVPVYSPGSAYFFETDNGGTEYNKCYFAVAATSVTHGDIWITETEYKFS